MSGLAVRPRSINADSSSDPKAVHDWSIGIASCWVGISSSHWADNNGGGAESSTEGAQPCSANPAAIAASLPMATFWLPILRTYRKSCSCKAVSATCLDGLVKIGYESGNDKQSAVVASWRPVLALR